MQLPAAHVGEALEEALDYLYRIVLLCGYGVGMRQSKGDEITKGTGGSERFDIPDRLDD